MSVTGRTGGGSDDVAATLGSASFVHLLAHADGDSLAAAALLARAVDASGGAYQVSVVRTDADADRRVAESDEDTVCCAVGVDAAAATTLDGTPRSSAAASVAAHLGADPDPATALAGTLAARGDPGDLAIEASFERRPGVGVPTRDLVDGLAHSTLFHAPYSGSASDVEAELDALDLPADPDAAVHRRVASLVALDAAGRSDVPTRAATAVERALRPRVGGPFETVEGYADVLGVLARTAPGLATALALGHGVREAALDAWRVAAVAVQEAVADADARRHSGVVVASVGDAPPWPVARLLRDYRAPEPAVLAVGDGEAVLATTDADAVTVARDVDADVAGTATRAYLRFDPAEETAVRETVRRAL